ncbi:hypothetical protein PQX77_016279 [Marasmius sp. AFHP31]|nr:hypothetical protein PQX77_016279 [Marasmius sp. AFHP31]
MEHQCEDCKFNVECSRAKIHGPPDVLYQHYLRNNGYPPPDQADSLVAGLDIAKAQSRLIRDTIARLQTAIASLEGEDSRIRDIIARYRTVIRPVYKLPPELLAKIFLSSLEPPAVLQDAVARTYPPHSFDTSKIPWVLGQVCTLWRRVVLQTPGIWASVYFSFRGGDATTAASQIHAHRLRLQLQRSANHPLTVVTFTPLNLTLSVSDPMVVLLASHTHHIRHLRIDLNRNNIPITHLSQGLFQALETLDIRILIRRSSSRTWTSPTNLDVFKFASRLNTLILSGDLSCLELKFPFLQITRFYWCDAENPDNSSLSYLRSFLAILYGLQKCRLSFHPQTIASYGPAVGGSAFNTISKLSFSCLQELELTCSTSERPVPNRGILTWITSSNLTSLTLFASGKDPATFSTLFPNPQRIVYLVIHQVEMPATEFADVLAKLTSLQTLGFGVGNGITDEYISPLQLTLHESETFWVAPKLRWLSLLATPELMSSYTNEKIVGVLETRRREVSAASGNAQLISVVLDRNVTDRSAGERLNSLISNGLRVQVTEGTRK